MNSPLLLGQFGAPATLRRGTLVLDLRDFVRKLRRDWMLIASITLVGLLLGGAATMATKPAYTAETQLFVSIQGSGSIQELQQGNTFSQARVQSYVSIVGSPVVLQPAIDSLGLSTSPAALSSRVKATTDLNTVLINISVTDPSPVQAAALAQAVGDSLISAVNRLEQPKSGGSSPVSLSVIKPATPPSAPASPNTVLNLVVGLLAGALVAVGIALLKAHLDVRVRGEEDLRRITDLPILGGIAFDHDATTRPLITHVASQSPRSESFRQLRTNLQFANLSGQARTVLVTSSLPGEGKSTTAANLAISLAEAGMRVCLVDADLRRPMVNEYFGLERNAGLTTALLGGDLEDLLQPWGDDDLFVLTSGAIPPNPSELLGSKHMENLTDRLEELFDIVVVDAPPLLPVTDAVVLAQHVGGVVLVVGAQKLKHNDLAKSLNSLHMVDAEILGVVLNRLPVKGPDAYAYAYGYYEEGVENNLPSRGDQAGGRNWEKGMRGARSYGAFDALLVDEARRTPSRLPRHDLERQ
ncbi:capsular exopolysaccharide synthesis family protein [Arthrobacter sp. B2I5]|nr:polysaccharide biosynthesis tyrosine autokinase [Arthrobacter sp. B2I5]MDQ0824606.1 capsular exopolysaccharide synthesis family protein [Arthrobacter sp. B2I5]